jgi:uncharacterized protein (TIGR03437 family)
LTNSPVVPINSIVNAASFAQGPVSPGSLVSIFGLNLAPPSPVSAGTVPLPTTLSGVTVQMGLYLAPLVYLSNGQINCQVPFELAGIASTTAQVIVTNGSLSSTATTVGIAKASPGIFTTVVNGQTIGTILKADYTLITSSRGAQPGDVILIFATGQGPVTNAPASGAAARNTPALSTTIDIPVVTIGGKNAPVSFSGLAPGFVALWQINVTVPSGLPTGYQPVQISQSGVLGNSANLYVVSP